MLEQTKVYLSKIIQVYTFYKSALCGKIASLNILLFTCNGRKVPSRLQESLFFVMDTSIPFDDRVKRKKDYALMDVIKTMDEDKSVSWKSIS